jgi:dTDP-4-dehydrorhamnose 3,5-epimerase
MKFTATALPDVILVEPAKFGDERGWFAESWHAEKFAQGGIEAQWVQDNHSFSAEPDTLRGLHYQTPPHAQAKLIRCTSGAIWDVAVDFRKASPTYLHHVGVRLDAASMHQLYVPAGFLHGFVTLEPDTEVQYKCSAGYAPAADAAVRWDDPEIAVDWPLETGPILSRKDAEAPLLSSVVSPF